MATSSSQQPLTLESTFPLVNTSFKIPILGFGVYQSHGEKCVAATKAALEAGYRHIDTAQFYANEAEVGQAVQESEAIVKRSDVFITTKILAAGKDDEDTYQKLVKSVQAIDPHEDGYVNLFLIHSARPGREKRKMMWLALERLLKEGKTRTIGVSNWGIGHIEELKEYATIFPPHVNQIELHPWCQQKDIVEYCHAKEIIVEAYSPLVRNRKAHDPALKAIAKKVNKTTAQVLIRYCLQKGWSPLPKSETPSRIIENADVYGFELSEDHMAALDGVIGNEDEPIVQAVTNH